ncbi:MAG: hypothetical protein N3A66_02290 [Planctomycetota bacterium]|nr:hypothetical protein [Planctomycetota bacterium]
MDRQNDLHSHPAVERRRSAGYWIFRASILILIAQAILKVIGLVQARVVGQFCDDITRDLYTFAFETVLGILILIGEDAIGPALLPVFMEEKEKRGEESAWRFASTALTFHFLLILVAVAAVFYAPEAVVRLVTRWDEKDVDPHYMIMAPQYVRYMVLALFGLSLSAATYRLLNAYKRFFLAALGDAVVKCGVIAALAIGLAWGWRLQGMDALCVFLAGAFGGGILKLLLHIVGLRQEMRYWRLRFDWRDPAAQRFLWLFLPLLAGIIFAKFRDEFNQRYVLTGLEAGLVSLNTWGRRIYQTLGTTVPYAVGIAMLPFFCEMALAPERRQELGNAITRSSRALFLAFAVAAAIIIALALPLTQFVYQAGRFTYSHCQLAAISCACYTAVLPFYAVEYILMQAFFSHRRMLRITIIGVIFSSLSMALSYLTVIHWGWQGAWALAAVAAAFTISRILKVICMVTVLRQFLPCFPGLATISFLGRACGLALASGGAAWLARGAVERFFDPAALSQTHGILFKVGPVLAISSLIGGLVAVALARLLCREEWHSIQQWVTEKLRRRRGESKSRS